MATGFCQVCKRVHDMDSSACPYPEEDSLGVYSVSRNEMAQAMDGICVALHGTFWIRGFSECPFCGMPTRSGC